MELTQICVLAFYLPFLVLSQPVPTDPCGGSVNELNCGRGQECRLIQVNCFRSPCPPVPQCVPSQPSVSTCRYGDPVLDFNYRPLSCSRTNQCPDSTVCNMVPDIQSTCCWDPSKPNIIPPENPCDRMKCTYRCELLPTPCFMPPCTAQPVCVRGPRTCATATCPPEHTCQVRNGNAECISNSGPTSCAAVSCVRGQICTIKNGRAQCVENPCNLMDCRYRCEVKPVPCLREPCPVQGVCVGGPLSCAAANCPPGNPCIMQDGYAKCIAPVALTCASVLCVQGSICEMQNGKPKCIARPLTCATVLCAPRMVCVMQNRKPKCIDGRAKEGFCPDIRGIGGCERNCERDSSCAADMKCCKNGCGTLCVSPVATPPPPPSSSLCGTKVCPPGTGCQLQEVVCKKAPCPPIAKCVGLPSNPQCPKGQGLPMVDVNGKAIFCGRGPARRPCPSGTACNIHPTDRFAVCCSKKVKTIKPGQCPPTAPGLCTASNCKADNECPGNMKCCKNGCGGGVCTAPYTPPSPTTPCDTKKCPPEMECQLQEVLCSTQPCLPVAMCAAIPAVRQCPSGLPFLDASGRARFCGRGPNRRDCPEGTYCNIHPTDRFAVCCTRKVNTVRPGQCPKVTGPGICISNCKADNECPGSKKCCKNGCGGSVCTTPVSFPPPPTTSPCDTKICPPTTKCQLKEVWCVRSPCPPIATCVVPSGDKKCPSGLPFLDISGQELYCGRGSTRKCPEGTYCQTHPTDRFAVCCPLKDKTIIKPGRCPPVTGPGICIVQCKTDNECPGNKKCCKNACGGGVCTAPYTPPTKPPPLTPSCNTVRCFAGTECRVKQIACMDPPCEVAAQCVRRNPRNGGYSCKVGRPVLDFYDSILRCGPRSKCPPQTHCSSGSRGAICCPGRAPRVSVVKPGRCPIVRPGTIGICQQACTGDSACSGSQKCCSNGCGRTCQNPILIGLPPSPPTIDTSPCGKKKCSSGQVCVLQGKCFIGRCPTRAICISRKSAGSASTCDDGYPVVNMFRRQQSCRSTRSCPLNTMCTNRFCCWDAASDLGPQPGAVAIQRPGTCPARYWMLPFLCDIFVPHCKADMDCREGQKCCRVSACNRKGCLNAQQDD